MIRLFLASLLFSVTAAPAFAAGLKVAVVAPTDGPFELLGRQIIAGAGFMAVDRDTEIIPISETCEPADAENLAKEVLASGAEAVIGFLCTESLEAVLPALVQGSIPALTLSVRSDILMEEALKNKWPFFRLVPSAKAEADKIADVILSQWKNEPLALIDDGTIHGRELVETVKAAVAEIGLTPLFTDTYRPSQEQQISLVRRLAKSGATHVFVGGDRADMAIIARDARNEKANLTLLGGETLSAPDRPVPLQEGTLAVTLPDYAALPQATALAATMAAARIVPEGYVIPAFAAVSLLEAAKDQAEKDGTSLPEALLKGPYPTVIGSIKFNAGHELSDNPYQLLQWQSGRFVPAPESAE